LSTYTIHLKNDKSYSCDENTSLLRAALDNDISLEYSCFEARCRNCRVKILQGKVENLQDEKVLTAEEKAGIFAHQHLAEYLKNELVASYSE